MSVFACNRRAGSVCYHDNSNLRASIFTKLHGSVGKGSDCLQLIKFWPSCSCNPGKGPGSAAGRKILAPRYYGQRAVFATLWALFTGRMTRSGKLPVLNLLTGQKIRVFAPQGRLVAPIHFKFGRTDGHVGPLACAKFHLNRHRGVGMRPQNIKNFHFS